MFTLFSLTSSFAVACQTVDVSDLMDRIGFNVLVVMVPVFFLSMIIIASDRRLLRERTRRDVEQARSEVLPFLDPATPLSAFQWSLVQVRLIELAAEREKREQSERAIAQRIARASQLDKSQWRD